jgi:hypothetical protein
MYYKTIALELIQENSELYEKLRSGKMLLTTIESYALDLKHSHEEWKAQLAEENPGSDPRQIAAEAMELAIQEIQDRLPSASPENDLGPLSLNEAISFVRPPTPNA